MQTDNDILYLRVYKACNNHFLHDLVISDHKINNNEICELFCYFENRFNKKSAYKIYNNSDEFIKMCKAIDPKFQLKNLLI